MSHKEIEISIVVPAYNEEARLPGMLKAYSEFFSRRPETIKLIIVVNGSTDRTAEIAQTFAEKYDFIRVIVEPSKIGKGGAVLLGLKAAKGKYVGFVDADGATPPESFFELYENRETCDVAIASRYVKGSEVSPKQPLQRRIASRCFNFLVRLLFGLKLNDTQCGAKLFRADVLQKILPRIGITNWAFDVNMLVQAHRDKFTVKEFPTTWHDQTGSQLRLAKAGYEMFLALIRLRLIYSPFKWVVDLYNRVKGFFS